MQTALVRNKHSPLHRRLGQAGLPIAVGILVTGMGTLWIGMAGGHWVVRGLGAALMLYALSGLFLPALRVSGQSERWLGPLCGVVTGVITSATSAPAEGEDGGADASSVLGVYLRMVYARYTAMSYEVGWRGWEAGALGPVAGLGALLACG